MYKAPSSPSQRPLSRGSSPNDEGSQPPAKRFRVSEDDEEDEDRPLAITTGRMNLPSSSRFENGARPHPSRRGGKGTSAMSTAQTAPVSIPPPSGNIRAEMNGEIPLQSTSGIAVKLEDQMDESQLDRLATGVTVDTAIPSSSSSVRCQSHSISVAS
jgi:histone acetyltransferase